MPNASQNMNAFDEFNGNLNHTKGLKFSVSQKTTFGLENC